MQIILHIGPHKTGSSYLQRELYNAADDLLINNVVYPKNNWISGGYGHALLVDNNLVHEIKSEINDIISLNPHVQCVILSSENFDRFMHEQINDLKLQLPWDTKIIYYARRCDKTLYANWQENVKFGNTDSFQTFLLRHLVNPHTSHIINHCCVIDKWVDIFGLSALSIIDYDSLLDSNVNLFDNFLTQFLSLDVCDFPSYSTHLENSSLNIVDCEILRNIYLNKNHFSKLDHLNITSSFFESYSKNQVGLEYLRGVISKFLISIELSKSTAIADLYNEFIAVYKSSFVTEVKKFEISDISAISDGYISCSDFHSSLVDVLNEFERCYYVYKNV